MLQLTRISLTQFKNYDLTSFNISSRVVGICGLNGKGKTNLLDAIYYCCFTKSYFPGSAQMNVLFGRDGFRLEANFENTSQPQKVVCINKLSAKKEFAVNDVVYEKLAEHIGKLPAVMIAPDDIEIITGGSEFRRKFVDTILCQLDAVYLQQLMMYNKILAQRNSLLKQAAEGMPDLTLLQVLDDQLLPPGNYVFEERRKFTERFVPLVARFYKDIARQDEPVSVAFQSKLQQRSFESILASNRDRDRLLQRTQYGPHRDDLVFELHGQPFKSVASQGQRKSLLFALKLAEYEMIKSAKGFSPILLLDDVFEKLDEDRMQNLLHWVCNENQGQVFITDTHRERLQYAFTQLEVDGQIIEL